MKDLNKVSSVQLYRMWKHLSVGMFTLVLIMMFSKILPPFFIVVAGLVCAGFLYSYIFKRKIHEEGVCLLTLYDIFVCLLVSSFIVIICNILNIWDIITLPRELTFIEPPFVPILYIAPTCFVVTCIVSIRQRHLGICRECRIRSGLSLERGKLGRIFRYESHFQLRNLILLFGLLTVICWAYYLFLYIDVNSNERDWYVFTWLTVIAFLLDEIYFVMRYYNLYLDLRESDEIILPEEISDVRNKIYIRFYVFCDDHIYLDSHATDPMEHYRNVIDTPFFTTRSVNDMAYKIVKGIALTDIGVEGDLQFFYGRKMVDNNCRLLRYFYFLPGKIEDYPELKKKGEWISFNEFKNIYSVSPTKLSGIGYADMTRLATIMLTWKVFDENGRRRTKLKTYKPSFNLSDVYSSRLDFQDDKWIRISMFNSDTPFYGLKRKWNKLVHRRKAYTSWN